MKPYLEEVRVKIAADQDAGIENAIGIIMQAKILIPLHRKGEKPLFSIQWIESGGMWGIDPQHETEYLQEVANAEGAELSIILHVLKVKAHVLRKNPSTGEMQAPYADMVKEAIQKTNFLPY